MFGKPPYVEPVPLRRRMWQAATGQSAHPYQLVQPRAPWPARAARRLAWWALAAAGIGAARAGKELTRGRYRRQTAPVPAAAAVWLAAWLLHLTSRGWVTALILAASAAPYVWWLVGLPAGRRARRRGLPPTAHRCWQAGTYLATSAWLVAAARYGAGPPLAGWLWLAITPTVTGALIWRYRTRTTTRRFTALEADWAAIAGLDGTVLLDVAEHKSPARVAFDIDLAATALTAGELGRFRPQVAKRFGVPQTNIILGYRQDRLEHRGHAEIIYDNPCDEPVIYDKTWIPTTADVAAGTVPFFMYPNGARRSIRLWYPGREPGIPGAGAVMTLFTGDIGSGKSAGMAAFLTQATFTGRVWPMAACPQGGASFPAWAGAEGQAAWKAPCKGDTLDPIMAQLMFLDELMDDRTERLAKYRWTDKWGDHQTGLTCWDYDITGWPAVVWACDEFWRLMLHPEHREIVKRLLKLGRKAGIIIPPATQYPGLDELGNDAGLRQPLVSGNKLCYRNSDGTTKSMILSPGMPAPDTIPAETPTGDDTKGMLIAESKAPGASLPNFSRSVWVQRDMHWARKAAAHTHPLEPEAEVILRRYLPAGRNYLTADEVEAIVHPAPPGQPADDETQPTTTATASPASTGPDRPGRKPTALDLVVAYLDGTEHKWAPTGVIAAAVNLPLSTVTGACSKAARRDTPEVVDLGHGAWGRPNHTRDRILEGAGI